MACALFRRQVIDEIGDLDARSFFLYCDDVDYSWRLRLAGYRAIFHPQARVFHDKRLTPSGGIQVGPSEEHFAAEAALILAHKWSRPDLVERFGAALLSGTPRQREALESFRQRELRGDLPEPIDPDHSVGQFFGDGYWAKPRW
jgi:GT2 family glycosyltransferase